MVNAYGVMKKGRPFNDYNFLIELDQAKKNDIGHTYLNSKCGLEFGRTLAEVER